MKNILFVSSQPPFKLFTGGDTQSEIILNFLKKKFNVTIMFWKDNANKVKIKILKKKISGFNSIIIKRKKIEKLKKIRNFLQFNSYYFNPFDYEIDNKTLNLINQKFKYCFLYDPESIFAFRNIFFMKKIIYSIPPTVVPKINLIEINANNVLNKLKKIILKFYYYKIEKFYYKILEKADYIITSNNREFTILKYKFKNKIFYLTMPHEDDFYSKKKTINNDKIIIVHAGHLKNSLTKISLLWIGKMIVPLIIKLNLTKKILFLILGKYKPDQEIRKQFKKVQAKFLGHVSKEKYQKILYNADAFIFAAKYRTYGYINRIISALSIPSSIVTTNKLIQDFKFLKNNVHLLANNNPNKFLKNIIELKYNKKLSKRLRKNARNIYKKKFSPKLFEEKINNFFVNNKIYNAI